MKNINTYITTYNKTNWILNITIPLFDKYWNIEKSVKILGYKKPEITLPTDYEFISMVPEQTLINNWANDIYSVIKKDPNEFVMFMLDDFLPRDYVDVEILNDLILVMKTDPNIIRCGLGIDLHFVTHFILEQREKYNLIQLNEDAPYKVSTQISIWRKEALLKYLKVSTDPWNFETNNNPESVRVIGTQGNYAFKWLEESGLSSRRHHNKLNILGLPFEDIKWILDNNLIDENRLQYGQHAGKVPQFSKYGFQFKIDVLKNYVSVKKYSQYLIRYGKTYK